MLAAVVAGLAAGALWALAFIAPGLVKPFSAADLTLMRYAVFGASSLVALAIWPQKRWRSLARTHWKSLIILALAGNTLYYILLSEALQRAGTLLPTLVIGALPVVMALLGGLRSRRFSIRHFLAPAALILGGLILQVGWPAVLTGHSSSTDTIVGLSLAIAALVSWAFYGLRNAEILADDQRIDLVAWTALTGVATALTLLPLAAVLHGTGFDFRADPNANPIPLFVWGGVLGLLSSWVATWLWNRASRVLSGDILGYLIVSETVFAIVYAFLIEWRTPGTSDLLSVGLLVLGVLIGIRASRRPSVAA